jgi:hypothetical protein
MLTNTVFNGNTDERRRAPRYQVIADAEIFEPHSGNHFQAHTSNISLLGCHINSVSGLPLGSEIQVRISKGNALFKAHARLVRSAPATGMGFHFIAVERKQKVILEHLLTGSEFIRHETAPMPAPFKDMV